MDNRSYKELTVFFFLLSFGTTFSGSLFGFNLGNLRDTAVNNIEQVPKILKHVNLFNRHKQHPEGKNQIAFQDNREVIENEGTLNPAKYENQQNWGLDVPAYPKGNAGYNGYKTTVSPSQNKYSQRQESYFDGSISFPNNVVSTDYNGYKNSFNPTTNKDQEGFSFAPTTSHFINKVTPENNLNYNNSPVNVKNRGSFYDGDKYSKPENDTEKNPAVEYLAEYGAEFGWDYSTTTDNDLTTTDEPLNRIGAPPAVVASILG